MSLSGVIRHVARYRAVAAGLAGAAVVAGCGGVATPAPVAAFPACPVPEVDTRGWSVVRDSAGVTYRLPAGLVQRPAGDLAYRQWTRPAGATGRVSIGFNDSREYWVTLRRAPSPGMHEMSECIDSIPTGPLLVQAWRTEGGSYRRGERSDLYEVLALVPLRPGLTLFVTGGSAERTFQATLLAIARTVEVAAR